MSKISKKNLIEAIEKETFGKTGVELNNSIKNIVKFLYNKKLLNKSKEILESLQKEIDKKEGTLRIKVKSAKAIGETKRKDLEHEMKAKYNAHHIESTYFEDRNLLGGMKIEVGEEVLDLTYRNKLNQLQKHLIKNN